MKELLDDIRRWREEGEDVVVATVVGTRRSAPRPVGSSFAVALDDREQHGAPAALLDRSETLQQVAHSTFSTKTSISPPQGRPTFQPSSSEIP